MKIYFYVSVKILTKLTFFHLLYVLTGLNAIFVIYTLNNFHRAKIYDTSYQDDYKNWVNWDIDKESEKVETQYPAIVWRSFGLRHDTETRKCKKDIICDFFSYQDGRQPSEVAAYLFFPVTMSFNAEVNFIPRGDLEEYDTKLVASFKKLPLPRQPNKIMWGFYHEETPKLRPELMHEKALNLFNFSSTFSRYSNVPHMLQDVNSLEYITTKKFFLETFVKNSLLNELAPIVYLQSNCDSTTDRDAYVRELMEFIKVDSYGACVNNKKLPDELKKDFHINHSSDEVQLLIAKYKFIIGIENSVCDDYVTEKFWRGIHVGVVPIYFGSPTVEDWFPNPKSAILIRDYPTPKLLAEHVKQLIRNDDLYDEYLVHKTEGKITNERLINQIKEKMYEGNAFKRRDQFECFVCKKLYDMKKQPEVHIVTKDHYNCPEPVSVLTFKVNPSNRWSHIWRRTKHEVNLLYKNYINGT